MKLLLVFSLVLSSMGTVPVMAMTIPKLSNIFSIAKLLPRQTRVTIGLSGTGINETVASLTVTGTYNANTSQPCTTSLLGTIGLAEGVRLPIGCLSLSVAGLLNTVPTELTDTCTSKTYGTVFDKNLNTNVTYVWDCHLLRNTTQYYDATIGYNVARYWIPGFWVRRFYPNDQSVGFIGCTAPVPSSQKAKVRTIRKRKYEGTSRDPEWNCLSPNAESTGRSAQAVFQYTDITIQGCPAVIASKQCLLDMTIWFMTTDPLNLAP